MYKAGTYTKGDEVTPFVGVWIEIVEHAREYVKMGVTPFVGVWIEIERRGGNHKDHDGHSLCGSVD